MKCIYCKFHKTIVKDSRDLTGSRYRRRYCTSCDRSFTTQEFVDGRKRPEDFTPEMHFRRIRSSLVYLEEVMKKIQLRHEPNDEDTQSVPIMKKKEDKNGSI